MIPEPFTLDRQLVDWQRHGKTKAPKILPPPGEVWRTPGGRKQAGRYYTRTTTLAKTLEDAHALYGWKVRRAILGGGQRPDLMQLAASLTAEDHDRDALDELGERLIEASGPSAAAIGTALHGFTERLDRGEVIEYVPEAFVELLEAWKRITAPLRLEYREVRTVHDGLGAAGTPDAFGFCSLPDPDGVVDDRRVIDLKSGKIKYPATMSAQLFVYADADLYDPETGERRPLEVNKRWGLIAHLASDGSEPPGLYWLNLEHGRRCVELALPVREWRAVKADEILRPALVEDRAPATPPADAGVVDLTDRLVVASERVEPEPVAELPAAPVIELDTPDPAPVTLHCHECTVDDPAPWCDCRPGEQCSESGGFTPCRRRAHGPDECPSLAIARCITDRDLEVLWTTDRERWNAEHVMLAKQTHAELKRARDLERPRAALLAAITVADRDRLRALWIEHGETLWTDEHTAAAGRRHDELEGQAVA